MNNALIDDRTRLFHALAMFGGKDGIVRATQAELAELIGKSQPWVSKEMRRLEDARFLVRDRRRKRASSQLVWRINEEFNTRTSVAQRNAMAEKQRKAPYPKPRPRRKNCRVTSTGNTLGVIDGGKANEDAA